MISLENVHEFIPHGRRVLEYHPAGKTRTPHFNSSFTEIENTGFREAGGEEDWELGKVNDNLEEVYHKGKSVIFSSGGHTRKCYTIGEDVLEVVRCTFYSSPDRPCILPLLVDQKPKGEPIHSICVRTFGNLRIFCDNGDDFKVALQFEVHRSWRSKFGLILERQVVEGEKPRPVLFCLLHPLDDLTRIVWKQGGKIGELTDHTQQIVFSDVESSIVVTYNTQTDLHSFWRVRRKYPEEVDTSINPGDTGVNSLIHSGRTTPGHSIVPVNQTPANNSMKMGSASPSFSCTPLGSRTSRQPSAFCTPTSAVTPVTRPGSPGTRHNSPQSMGALLRSGVSPSFSSRVTARLGETTCRLNRLNFSALESEAGDADPLPLAITLCFEHIWSEPLHLARELTGKAKKVFMSKDTVGQLYLCLLLPTNQLHLIKYKYANDDSTTMIFGTVEKIPAVDAAPIEDINMIMVLDTMGTLTLYSGSTKVGKAILPPSSTTLLSQEISALVIDSKPGTPFPSTETRLPFRQESVSVPFRSTPILQSRSGADGPSSTGRASQSKSSDRDFSFLSPVNTDLSSANIVRLRDPCSRQVTLVYSTGYLVRVSLPKVSTSLVAKGLEAVKQLLPLDLACQLHSSWYTKRHAPGPTPAPGAEWDMFCKCILGLSGYQVDQLDLSTSGDITGNYGCPGPKKSKTESGTDGDWQYLLDSPQHTYSGHSISKILRLEHVIRDIQKSKQSSGSEQDGEINLSSPLFSYIPALFWALHLLYEEFKLDTSLYGEMPFLVNLLSRLAADLRLVEYQHHYWKDFPENSVISQSSARSQLTPSLLSKLNVKTVVPTSPPCVYSHLHQILLNQPVKPFPVISPTNQSIKLVTACMAVLACQNDNHAINLEHYLKPWAQPGRPNAALSPVIVGEIASHTVAEILCHAHWDRVRIGNLPPSLAVPIYNALFECQQKPDPAWGPATLQLIGREDLANYQNLKHWNKTLRSSEEAPDGLEGLDCDIARLRWPKDLRISEARRVLQSCKPVVISVEQGPEVSDHDFVEEQEYFLKRMCERTMALPVGRGIAALRTVSPLPTETLSIPQLCLTGKAPPRGTRVELTHIDYSQNMDHWPSFHNGVAAGLRLIADSNSQEVDSTWISFNKPPNAEANAETEHAGFLMALGLNGHLSKLSKLDAFEYLNKGSEPISIGLLIGVAASHFGTMDVMVTKKLATQLEALLPPTATELPLSHNTQVAALLGIGLLYANTGHRHMVEVCVKELGKPPGPELENCVDRESYSLSAGLALGLITMGQGEALAMGNLADLNLNLPNVLHNHMLGGPRPKPNSSQRERPQSYQIKEGESINIDITSPGATLALGMMYWKSGNKTIASWMEAPDTIFLLDFVRPDFLMLRTLAKGLIMWNQIQPTVSWIESHVAPSMLPHCMIRPPDEPAPGLENLDYETLNQAYCNIISGAAFVLALRFAGTWNQSAFDALEQMLKKFIAISKRSIAELTGKAVIEQTICILVLSQGIVMAGSGDLSVLRTCRYLRSRVHTSTIVTYGSHMAVHTAVGLLFMGGGRYGLASSPSAVAAMIIAFFPKFPTHSNDNRYHLQAFRHLYVLAVEPRLLVPRCSQTNEIIPCSLTLKYSDTEAYAGPKLKMMSPVLLPSLDLLYSVCVDDKQFWTSKFVKDENWEKLRSILNLGGNIVVKQASLVSVQGFQWSLGEEDRSRLELNHLCRTLLDTFLKDTPDSWRTEMESLVATCMSYEQIELISVVCSIVALPNQLSFQRVGLVAQQLRSLLGMKRMEMRKFSLDPELELSLLQRINSVIDRVSRRSGGNFNASLRNYATGSNNGVSQHCDRQLLAAVVCTNNIPIPTSSPGIAKPNKNPLKMLDILKKSPNPASLHRMIKPVT